MSAKQTLKVIGFAYAVGNPDQQFRHLNRAPGRWYWARLWNDDGTPAWSQTLDVHEDEIARIANRATLDPPQGDAVYTTTVPLVFTLQ